MPEIKAAQSADHLIGRTVKFRPLNEKEFVSDVIVAVEPLFRLGGSMMVELTLAQGRTVDAAHCYFSEPVSLTA
jgi:hypothetical protein